MDNFIAVAKNDDKTHKRVASPIVDILSAIPYPKLLESVIKSPLLAFVATYHDYFNSLTKRWIRKTSTALSLADGLTRKEKRIHPIEIAS